MIYNIIALSIMVYAVINFKKAYCYFILFQLFWYNGASLISFGGRSVTASLGMNLFFLVLYIIKHPRLKKMNKPFPFTIPMLFMSISMLLTCFTAVGGFGDEFIRTISSLLQFVFSVWLMWRVVGEKNDWEFLFKGLTLAIFLACLYGLIEYLTHYNFLFEIKSSITEGGINNYNSGAGLNEARGYRLLSIFEHPIGAGMTMGLYVTFVLNKLVKTKTKLPYHILAVLTTGLCIVCIVLTKMRSAMLFTVIAAIPIVDFKRKRFFKIIGLLTLVFVIAWPFISPYFELFLSLFNKESLMHSSTGSSITQRMDQFKAVFALIKNSPIGGLGQKFGDYISNSYTKAAGGYESVWLEQLSRNGLLGAVANIIMLFFSIVIIPHKYKSLEMRWLCLAYWITYSVSSIPSFRITIYYLIIFYYLKTSKAYNSSWKSRDFVQFSTVKALPIMGRKSL